VNSRWRRLHRCGDLRSAGCGAGLVHDFDARRSGQIDQGRERKEGSDDPQ
jgi:hypothetical protein